SNDELHQLAVEVEQYTDQLIEALEKAQQVDEELCKLLPPGAEYMAPPDGGDVTPLEGVRRMVVDYRQRIAELESRTVPSSMTPRESVIWFDLHEDEQSLKNKVAEHPHSKFLVCNEDIDHIIGYVDSK
ncbi:hypothetical protein FPK36_20680, partial [Acinetobacter baumannii]|nr:hypothetical protein [Acinetobacter baumannii]